MRKGHGKERPHGVLMWQDRRVTWKRQTRCWEAPREDREQRAWDRTRLESSRGKEKREVAETHLAVGQPRRTKSYRASQCGLRLVGGRHGRKAGG